MTVAREENGVRRERGKELISVKLVDGAGLQRRMGEKKKNIAYSNGLYVYV